MILLVLLSLAAQSQDFISIKQKQNPTIRITDFDSLKMSDPFILPDNTTHTYFLTGSNGAIWKSSNLKTWQGPFNVAQIDTNSWMGVKPMIWAAEIHKYKNRYFYFATFTNSRVIIDSIPFRYNIPRRASHILVSDKVEGPYKSMNNRNYLPSNEATLDGTFWIEDGVPYMVYCHEWLQIIDGTMVAIQLKPDLSDSEGKPFTLFRASDAPWAKELNSIGEITNNRKTPGWVTDGPYLFKTKTGRLGMIWSSWGDKRYALGVAYSQSGKLKGPWIQEPEPLISNNSGHGMLFRTFEGKLLMSLHYQSSDPKNPQRSFRKPMLLEVDDSGDSLKVIGRYNP